MSKYGNKKKNKCQHVTERHIASPALSEVLLHPIFGFCDFGQFLVKLYCMSYICLTLKPSQCRGGKFHF